MIIRASKYIVVLLLLLHVTLLRSQDNLPYVDDKPFHFGFLLGTNLMDFSVGSSLQTIDGKVYYADVSTLQPGFSVGVISNLRLNNSLNLRFNPTLHFLERSISYRLADEETKTNISIISIPASIPLYLKYSAQRRGNYRPYIIGGGGFYVDLARNKEKPVLLKPFDTFVEIGAGCDFYFSFFKLAPEIKFGLGMNNMLTPMSQRNAGTISEQDKKYTNALSSLKTKMLTITFNFE